MGEPAAQLMVDPMEPSPIKPSPAREAVPSRSRPRFPWWAALGCLTLLALGLRLYRIGHDSLWIDEVASIEVARQSLHDIVYNYRPGMHPDRGAEQAPLALAVMHFFLPGESIEAAARLPSALLGVAGVLVLYALARRIVAAPAALLAAALLTLSPLHVWYSQEARWYAQWILLTTASYWALLRATETGQPRAWLAYWLCAVLNVYTFILSFLIVACQGVSVLLLALTGRTSRRAVPTFAFVQVPLLIATAPVLRMIIGTMGLATGTPRPTGLAGIPYTFFTYAAGYSLGPTTASLHALPGLQTILVGNPSVVLLALVFAPLLVASIWWLLRHDRRAAIILLPWCFGPVLLVYAVSLSSNLTYQARYSSAALPAFLLLVALGIRSLSGRSLRAAAVTATVACCLWSLGNHYWNPQYAKEDVKRAVAHVAAADSDGASIVVVGQVASAVLFYGPQLRVVPIEQCDEATALRATAEASLWFVVGRDWEQQASACLAQLTATHALLDRRTFRGVDVWHFGPRPVEPVAWIVHDRAATPS